MSEKVQPENVKTNVPEDAEKLENGPIEERHCTDIICFILFIAGNVIYCQLFLGTNYLSFPTRSNKRNTQPFSCRL